MKKTGLISLLLVLGFAGMGMAQGSRVFELHGGYFNPKGIDGGLHLGGMYGIAFDERVDLSLGLSYFGNKSSVKKYGKENEGDGVETVDVTQTTEYSNSLLPVSINLTINMPLQRPLYWYFGGGVTYEFLFVKKTTYTGFGWTARAGIQYVIGSRSSLVFEAFYNGCKPRANREEDGDVKTWEEVNVSGLGFRAGVKLDIY